MNNLHWIMSGHLLHPCSELASHGADKITFKAEMLTTEDVQKTFERCTGLHKCYKGFSRSCLLAHKQQLSFAAEFWF